MLLKNKKIILLSLLFLFVAILTHVSSIDFLDKSISSRFYNFLDNSFLTGFFSLITTYAIVFSLITMSLIIYLRTKNIYKLIIFAVITISQSLIVNFIQIVIQRPRPFVISDIVYLGSNIPTAFSFPSGHTTFAFFLAYLATHIFQLSKVQTVIVYLIALLIAFSRLYLGAHYILDIVGGMLLGTLLAMVTFKIYLKIV